VYVYIPKSGVTLLFPPLLFDSLVIQPPLYSLLSSEAGVPRGFVPASPAVSATYSSRWDCPRSFYGWERAMKRGKEQKKDLSVGSAVKESACSILQEKTTHHLKLCSD